MKNLYRVMGENECSRDEVIEKLSVTDKVIKYTFGLGFRNPTIHKVVISNEEAVEKFKSNSGMCDVTEYDDWIHLNEFSGNDLW